MLVALSAQNFKNIKDARLRFGTLTCLIGHNGAGKSNLFDAIGFLAGITRKSATEEAGGGSASASDVVFGRDPKYTVRLSADMIAPRHLEDDFGEDAVPGATLLTYEVSLRFEPEDGNLLVERESLTCARPAAFGRFVGFPTHSAFGNSVAAGGGRTVPLISTEGGRITLHGESGSRGWSAPAGRFPFTVLSKVNSHDYPTTLAAKREMASWRVMHLNPREMRGPDSREAEPRLSRSGSGLATMMHALLLRGPDSKWEVLRRLQALAPEVMDVEVRPEETSNRLMLRIRYAGTEHWTSAASLPDGTLRHIALALIPSIRDRGLLCIEEIENGTHPSIMPALVDVLRDYAVDAGQPVGSANPLRQVVVSTHSPEVARQLSVNEVVFAERGVTSGRPPACVFRHIQGTWRDGDTTTLPVGARALADFVGGSPVGECLKHLDFRFGTARQRPEAIKGARLF